MSDRPILQVIVEATAKRAFASALDWPGWARSGKDEARAIEALLAYRERYAPVPARAHHRVPARPEVEVVERQAGDAGTDFGAPHRVAELELRPVTSADARRLAELVQAAWDTLADVAAVSPVVLRKGPRGGGRDRDKMLDHVAEADRAYARSMGIRLPAATPIEEVRAAMHEAFALPSDGSALPGGTWPQRYAARRVAWHALDHAWEMEDRSSDA